MKPGKTGFLGLSGLLTDEGVSVRPELGIRKGPWTFGLSGEWEPQNREWSAGVFGRLDF